MQRRPSLDMVKACMGWEAKVSLEEGLRKTLASFRANDNQE
jgi:nucleoside-diphosphate-sugar epimerase